MATHSRILLLSLIAALSLEARVAEPAALSGKLRSIEGDGVLQRGADLIAFDSRAKKKDREDKPLTVEPGDAVRILSGAAEITYDDGSQIRVEKDTVATFASGASKEPSVKDRPVTELRVRVAIGRVSSTIRRDPLRKVVFLMPQGRAALLEGSLQVTVNHCGDWEFCLGAGEALLTEMSIGITWAAAPGQKFRGEYIPGGLRLSNLDDSKGRAAITFHTEGDYDVVAEKGTAEVFRTDGRHDALKEGQSTHVILPPSGVRLDGPGASGAVLFFHGRKPEGVSKIRQVVRSEEIEGKPEASEQAKPEE